MKYANIVNGVVNIIEIKPEKVAELEGLGLILINISGLDPKPKKGWLYDGSVFSEPEKTKKNKSKKHLLSKLSDSEIRDIQDKAKNDDELNGWLFRLGLDNDIDYHGSLDLLVSKLIIDQVKADEIKEE